MSTKIWFIIAIIFGLSCIAISFYYKDMFGVGGWFNWLLLLCLVYFKK